MNIPVYPLTPKDKAKWLRRHKPYDTIELWRKKEDTLGGDLVACFVIFPQAEEVKEIWQPSLGL